LGAVEASSGRATGSSSPAMSSARTPRTSSPETSLPKRVRLRPAARRAARDAFLARGAAVTYRELPDLAHAFPTEQCPAVLDWLAATPAGGAAGG